MGTCHILISSTGLEPSWASQFDSEVSLRCFPNKQQQQKRFSVSKLNREFSSGVGSERKKPTQSSRMETCRKYTAGEQNGGGVERDANTTGKEVREEKWDLPGSEQVRLTRRQRQLKNIVRSAAVHIVSVYLYAILKFLVI